ncbi:MAG: DUF389 domain-containing protein [Bacteroidales bacterium]|nr:DUF389 domain-containing protein [Bacteroidales bacterium]
MKIKDYLRPIKGYFNLMADKEDEQQVVEQVSAGVAFRGANLWILIFAILIASLGLNVNSTAVIIGAMLVSPLMGPIIGMGLGVGISDYDLFRRALKNYGVATLISIATATLYFLLSPLGEAQSELLARTSPSLYDVLIAFCGGAAGVLALTTKSKGQVIPGVAIATALMPPLCTAGYGLATAQWSYFFGAFYLFFINTVFIALSTFLGVKLLRFHTVRTLSPEVALRGRRMMVAIVVVAMLPAAWMTVSIVRRNVFEQNVRQFVARELNQNGTRILSHNVEHDTLHVVAVGRTISESEIADARSRMDYYRLGGYGLEVIQGDGRWTAESIDAKISSLSSAADAENHRLTARVALLEGQLASYARFDTLAVRINAEAQTLFPEVRHVELGHKAGRTGGTVVVVEKKPSTKWKDDTERRLKAWLQARLEDDQAVVVVR